MYAVLTVSDENTYRRLPSTGPYSVSKFEMAIRIGLAPVGPMLVSDRLTDSKDTILQYSFSKTEFYR